MSGYIHVRSTPKTAVKQIKGVPEFMTIII